MLATVKSPFGSRGVVDGHVMGTSGDARWRGHYALLNDEVIRNAVVSAAAARYGYAEDHVFVRLYVGKFAAPVTGAHEAAIRNWCGELTVGGGPVAVYGLDDVVAAVRGAAESKTYRNNPVLVTMKVLDAAGLLRQVDATASGPTMSADDR